MASSPNRTISAESNTDDSRKPSWAYDDSERRTFSRKRSLECSAIEIRITNTELTQNHTEYVINVNCGMRSWIIKRRYKDFDYLDRQLKKQFPSLRLPTLPPKRYLRSSSDPEIVDERKEQLQNYLNQLVAIQQVWARNDFVLFLNDESNLMTFIWSFERMRRLQDMIRVTQIENQEEKSQLNDDLLVAEKQVKQLQEKLSQMEMLFLQQAAGMAKEQLPSSLIRSISGVQNNSHLAAQLQAELTQEERDSLYGARSSAGNAVGLDLDSEEIDEGRSEKTRRKSESSVTTSGGESVEEGSCGHSVKDDENDDEDEIQPQDVMKAIHMVQDNTLVNHGLARATTPDERRVTAVTWELQEALRISQELFDHSAVASGGGASTSNTVPTSSAINPSDLVFGPQSATPSSNVPERRHLAKLSPTKFTISKAEEVLNLYNSESAGKFVQHHGSWVETLFHQMSVLEEALIPNEKSLENRFQVFLYVRDLISRTLGVPLFPIGSTISHTFLKDSDMNCTAFVSAKAPLVDDTWYVKVNEALCLSAFQQQSSSSDSPVGANNIVVSNVSFVNREMKMIRSIINGITVDITMNQYQSLFMETVIERVDDFIGRDHLFKRSFLLIKAWFQYESSKYTYGGGSLTNANTAISTTTSLKYVESNSAISTWSIAIMLIATFHNYGADIYYPFQALGYFFRYTTNFDWMNTALTVFGAVPISSLEEHHPIENPSAGFFPADLFKFCTIDDQLQANKLFYLARQQQQSNSTSENVETEGLAGKVNDISLEGTGPSSESNITEGDHIPSPIESFYNVGILNLIDPLSHVPLEPISSTGSHHNTSSRRSFVNLFATINNTAAENFLEALHTGYKHYQTLCESCSKVLSFGGFSEETIKKEIYKFTKEYFFNTSNQYALSEDSFFTISSTKLIVDCFHTNKADLNFARSYSEMILGGRIDNELLTQLVVLILEKKGPMPVGEIGKNLQALLGCELLSKRLKEQFSGLKKAIEHSNSRRLVVGSEHPFNPIVKLADEEKGDKVVETEKVVVPWSFDHLAYIYTPYNILAQLQGSSSGSSVNGSQATGRESGYGSQGSSYSNNRDNCSVVSGMSYRSYGGNYRNSYRRPPPVVMDASSNYMNSAPNSSSYPHNNGGDYYGNKRGSNSGGSYRTNKNNAYSNNSPNRNNNNNNNLGLPPNSPNSPYYRHQLPPGAIPIPPPHGYPTGPLPMELMPVAGSPVGLYPAYPMFSTSPVQLPYMPFFPPPHPHGGAVYPPHQLPPQQQQQHQSSSSHDHSS